jgi:hypothetical protein
MNSRVHPTYKTKYRVANWASYDRALVGRGDITMWVSPEAIASWEPLGVGARGGQQKYSNVAIGTALTLRLLFHLPLRQAEGFLRSLFGMMGLELSAPDHTTLSPRGQLLDLRLRRVPTGKGLHLIVDSTGLSIVGEGEWAKAKHGVRGTRGWKQLHLGVDRSGVIVAHALTRATVDDAPFLNRLRPVGLCLRTYDVMITRRGPDRFLEGVNDAARSSLQKGQPARRATPPGRAGRSIGSPLYCATSGSMSDTAIVSVGNTMGEPART